MDLSFLYLGALLYPLPVILFALWSRHRYSQRRHRAEEAVVRIKASLPSPRCPCRCLQPHRNPTDLPCGPRKSG